MERNELIDAIVRAARKPCPKIVTRYSWFSPVKCRHYSALHPPSDLTGCVRHDYFVFADSSGTTYGKQYPTQEQAQAAWTERDVFEDRELRRSLSQMTDERLAESADYWLRPRWNSLAGYVANAAV